MIFDARTISAPLRSALNARPLDGQGPLRRAHSQLQLKDWGYSRINETLLPQSLSFRRLWISLFGSYACSRLRIHTPLLLPQFIDICLPGMSTGNAREKSVIRLAGRKHTALLDLLLISLANFRLLFPGRKILHVLTKLRQGDGRVFPCRVSVAPVCKLRGGALHAGVAVFRLRKRGGASGSSRVR